MKILSDKMVIMSNYMLVPDQLQLAVFPDLRNVISRRCCGTDLIYASKFVMLVSVQL